MNAPQPASDVGTLERLYRLALRLYPGELRQEYAEEMQAVFHLQAGDAARQGRGALVRFAWREARDLPLAVGRAHWRAGKPRRPLMLARFFPESTDQIPWRTALLSLVPFALTGIGGTIISYHPGWDPEQLPWVFGAFGAMVVMAILAGFILGVLRQFPRWFYLYAGGVLVVLLFLAAYLLNRTPWDVQHESGFLLLVPALAFLATCRLPTFRPFYANIGRDWTLLSYCLYAGTLFLLATHDSDETPRLNLQVLMPSIIALAGALAHLRLASARPRVAVLLASMLLGVFVWWLPVFDGMMGSWATFVAALSAMLTFWAVLAVLIVAPILVNVSIRPRQAT